MLIFLVQFAQVFLVAFNSRNAVQARYLSSFLISLLITFCQVISTKLLWQSNFSLEAIIATAFGGALGVVLGAWTHKRFMKKKPVTEW